MKKDDNFKIMTTKIIISNISSSKYIEKFKLNTLFVQNFATEIDVKNSK